MIKKIVLFVVIAILLVAGFLAWKFVGPAVSSSSPEFLYIKTGASYADVQSELKEKKVLGSTAWFNMMAGMLNYENVKPGRYKLKKGMSLLNLVRVLRNGQQTPVNFVITKIRTKEVLASRIGKAFECDSTDMMAFLNSSDSLKEYGLDSNTAMAVAMPLTYSIKWNTSPEKIFQQFDLAWKNFWTAERKQKAEDLGLTPFQVSTIASIIDEETNAESDRPNMASVYINRVRKGMPLQADPTLKFALKNFGIKRVLNIHKEVNSPYNTYVNRGLPPGPICTPQQETIEAVLNSPQTDYLYFVANSDGTRTHIFTTNYDDHMKYARIYQQHLNNRNIR
jgi:UPF0755 protein